MDNLPPILTNDMRSEDAPLLEIKNLTKHFLGQRSLFGKKIFVHAADQVTLYVKRGETWGL